MTDKKFATKIIHTEVSKRRRTVNPPIAKASTVLFENEVDLYGTKPNYGRYGLEVHQELKDALCELEQANFVALTSSGLTACALSLASFVQSGDHILVNDTIYKPTRRFCYRALKKMGVEVTRYPARIGAGIEKLIQPNTKVIYIESPGSLTFELVDVNAITEVAKSKGIATVSDNTWGAGVFHKPLTLGVDVSVQSLTKYPVGHADAFGGAVMAKDKQVFRQIQAMALDWGLSYSPDDAYLALRGLRTIETRMKAHEKAALEIANWLRARSDKVAQVLNPALPDHEDHEIWQRDYTGVCGLFGILLQPFGKEALDRAFASLQFIRMGFSYGGYESLLIPSDPQLERSEGDWTESKVGPLLRLHVGLEDTEDIKEELGRFLDNLH